MKKLACLIPLLIVGCSSISYKEPRNGSQPLGTVTGSYTKSGLYSWTKNSVSKIDDKLAGGVFTTTGSKFNVVPGPHSFVLNSDFRQGYSAGPYAAIVEVQANIVPGVNYRFVSAPKGAHINVWAVDGAGKIVSSIGSAPYHYAPPKR